MNYNTLLISLDKDIYTITLNRIKNNNSMNAELIAELTQALGEAEKDDRCITVVIQGQQGLFCTGMDFQQLTDEISAETSNSFGGGAYMEMLKKISSLSKIVIAKVDGKVLAGGMGIVAACDVVIATPKSQFGLSEAMWGLLPANVMPFLIRRVGFQAAYLLTLSMKNITAEKANRINLVDEVSENLDEVLRLLMINFRRISSSTVAEAKMFFRKMWIINDEMEQCAINELAKLIVKPEVKENIKNYVLHKKLPWDKE